MAPLVEGREQAALGRAVPVELHLGGTEVRDVVGQLRLQEGNRIRAADGDDAEFGQRHGRACSRRGGVFRRGGTHVRIGIVRHLDRESRRAKIKLGIAWIAFVPFGVLPVRASGSAVA